MKYTLDTREAFKRSAQKGNHPMIPYYYRRKYGKKYPVRVQQEYFDMGAWKKRDIAYADKPTLKRLLSINKIKGSLSRYKIVK